MPIKDKVPLAKSNKFKRRELIPLIVIIAVILAIGITLISYKLTPEQTISKYNPMSGQYNSYA